MMRIKLGNIAYTAKHQSILQCPFCKSSMIVTNNKSIICSNNHLFDFSKHGYINLLSNKLNSMYTKQLFEARRELIKQEQFFSPINQKVADLIFKHIEKETIVDLGCGEGSQLFEVQEFLLEKYQKPTIGIGIDISKAGIQLAAKSYTDNVWIVSDLSNIPLQDNKLDCILNILSPSNYSEFKRILKDDGLIIKVVPQSDYLKELRNYFFKDSKKESYVNDETIRLFKQNFHLVDNIRVSYKSLLDTSSVKKLIQMTPLTWHISEEEICSYLNTSPSRITIDMNILVGKK